MTTILLRINIVRGNYSCKAGDAQVHFSKQQNENATQIFYSIGIREISGL